MAGLLGPWLAPYPYDAVDYTATWQKPSAAHWFGTDELGRDILSRLVYSLRNAILIAFGAEVITLFFGCTIGALAGYMGGRVDNWIMRFTDLMFAFPSLLFNVVLVSIMGRGMVTIFIAIGVTAWVGMARLVRGQVLALKQMEYVEAARAAGASHVDIIFRYLLPNTMGVILVTIGMGIPRDDGRVGPVGNRYGRPAANAHLGQSDHRRSAFPAQPAAYAALPGHLLRPDPARLYVRGRRAA